MSMSLPTPTGNQSTFNNPAPMRAITWAINPNTETYDIFNTFNASTNQGNLEVIKSKIYITLSTLQTEWAPQPDFGIPLDSFSQFSDNPDILANVILDQILTVENVNSASVVDLNYVPTTRQFTATFNVNTLYGITNISIG